MIDIPKDIEKYLVKDEVVEEEFRLKNRTTLYATTKRLFIKKGRTVKDVSYAHISSIELKSSPRWEIILFGILAGIAGYYLQQGNTLGWALIFLGVVLIIYGFIRKSQTVNLSVAGITKFEPLEADRDTLDEIFQFVRERRV